MSKCKIISMQCGDDESYALLFQKRDGRVVLDVYDASTHELVQSLETPFPVSGLEKIRHVQSFDVMFFAQGDTRPCKLTRESTGDGYLFKFEDNEFLPEPIVDWETNSEHTIDVFALPDSELIATKDGSQYYPKGVVRGYNKLLGETVPATLESAASAIEHDGSYEYRCYVYGDTRNAKKYAIGAGVVFLTSGLANVSPTFNYRKVASSGTGGGVSSVVDCNGAAVSFTAGDNVNVVFPPSGVVEEVLLNKIKIYVGSIFSPIVSGEVSLGYVTSVSDDFDFLGYYTERKVARAKKDVSVSISAEDADSYQPPSGGGFDVALTIDGSNENENIVEGQILALEGSYRVYQSGFWDYDSVLEDPSAVSPPVDVLQPLAPKKDYKGNNLRPSSGGGYGLASDFVPARGEVELKTEGLWSGVIELQELDSNQNVNVLATITSENGNSNTSLTRDIEEFGSCVRVACTRREKAYQINRSVTGDGNVIEKVLECDEGLQWSLSSSGSQVSYVRIKGKKTLNDGKAVYIAEVISGVYEEFSTKSYALGAWSSKNGFPEHVAIYQERLVYAGNKVKPTTIWLSKTNNWEDFEHGTDDSSAISATLATEKYDRIQWVLPNKNGITIGTSYSEYSFGAADGGITTADNARATATSSIGSSGVKADMFGVATVMVKTGGEELYRIDYNTLSEESAGNQISLLASHLFEGDPVVDMFTVKAPSNMLFCLHESGKLSSLTYEPDYSVTGWARHEILGGIDSGCVIRREGKDVLCLVVNDEGKRILGEINLQSDVWTDDGKSYESHVVTTPISLANTTKYGSHKVIAGCDIYVGKESKQFYAKLSGGDWIRIDNGFNVSGSLRNFDASRVEIPATSSWEDEAIVEVKSSSPEPLVLYAIGASIMA